MPMKTTEVHYSTETLKRATTREPLPRYDSNGEANPSPPPTAQAAGPEPRPVTAKMARRRRLWEEGILVLEEKSLVLGPIDEGLTTKTVHSNPRRESQRYRLCPEEELVFVPSASEEATAQLPPLRVHRRRRVIRVRPDSASRYGGVYRLLTAAECTPDAVGEDLGRLTWGLLYGSIEAAKRAERIMREANGFAAG